MSELVTWETVPGWFDWMSLYDEVAATTPDGATVVEVGVAFGKSLFYLAQKIRETGKNIRIMAVDKWQPHPETHFIWHPYDGMPDSERVAYEYAAKHGGIFEAFLYNLYHSGFANMIDVVRADSSTAACLLVGHPPHFVFIDAGHEASEVEADIDEWWGAYPQWMAGHDYNRGSDIHFPGVWKTVDAKWGQEHVEWVGQTCWVVRRTVETQFK
jgi:Methyltransferase domain